MEYIREDNSKIEFITILENPAKATVFRHFKGKEYKIITIAKDSNDLSEVVVYQAQYAKNQCWTRNIKEFFSLTDKEKYPNAQKYRFEKKTEELETNF